MPIQEKTIKEGFRIDLLIKYQCWLENFSDGGGGGDGLP